MMIIISNRIMGHLATIRSDQQYTYLTYRRFQTMNTDIFITENVSCMCGLRTCVLILNTVHAIRMCTVQVVCRRRA